MQGEVRRLIASQAAEITEGVLSRHTLRTLGITHDHVRREIGAGRWRSIGNQTVVVHTGPIGPVARRWSAIWETGATITALDGVSALLDAGMTGFDDDTVHVSVRHSHTVMHMDGVRVHKIIRRQPGEVAPAGIPRVRPAIAAIRAAGWAVSDRQAALVLVMPVQQRLVLPAQLTAASHVALGRRRRALIKGVVGDVCSGVQALGELDFARLCRARGLPEPTRQVVRRAPGGRIYLDVYWDEYALAVEIDGSQHRLGLAVLKDNLRQNAVVLAGDRVLRIDLLGLRLEGEAFLDQVAIGLGFPQLVRGITSLYAAS